MFDLDGTLVPLDQDKFIRGYFGLLVPELSTRTYRLIRSLMRS